MRIWMKLSRKWMRLKSTTIIKRFKETKVLIDHGSTKRTEPFAPWASKIDGMLVDKYHLQRTTDFGGRELAELEDALAEQALSIRHLDDGEPIVVSGELAELRQQPS